MRAIRKRHFVKLLAGLTMIGCLVGGVALAQRSPGGASAVVTDDSRPSLGPEQPTLDLKGRAAGGGSSFVSTTTGGAITSIVTVREDAATSTSSTAFVDIPGATATITVPAGQSSLFIATFSAESTCTGTSGWCAIRIMLTGPSSFEMLPAAGANFAFDSNDGGTETIASWEGHSMQRSFSVSTAGTWTVQAQQLVTATGMTFALDDWLLRVERATFP